MPYITVFTYCKFPNLDESIPATAEIMKAVAEAAAGVSALGLPTSEFLPYVIEGEGLAPVTRVIIEAFRKPERTDAVMKELADVVSAKVSAWAKKHGMGPGVSVTLRPLDPSTYFEYNL